MAPEGAQDPFLQDDLSSLEVGSLEILIHPSESQQDESLYTLTAVQSEVEIVAISHPFIQNDGDCCCCCCCPACCC